MAEDESSLNCLKQHADFFGVVFQVSEQISRGCLLTEETLFTATVRRKMVKLPPFTTDYNSIEAQSPCMASFFPLFLWPKLKSLRASGI